MDQQTPASNPLASSTSNAANAGQGTATTAQSIEPATSPVMPVQQASTPVASAADSVPSSASPATTPPTPAAGTPAAPATNSSTAPVSSSSNTGSAVPAKKSSMKILLAIFVVAILGAGGVVAYQMSMNKTMYQDATITKQATPKVQTMPSPTVGSVKSGDAQLDQQSEAIDKNMDNLNADVSNVDKGLQEQPADLNQ